MFFFVGPGQVPVLPSFKRPPKAFNLKVRMRFNTGLDSPLCSLAFLGPLCYKRTILLNTYFGATFGD